jgi:uncharacterized protein YlzI (FlbEa/FlbD family)
MGIIVGDVEVTINGDAILPFVIGNKILLNGDTYLVKEDAESMNERGEEIHNIVLVRCDGA